MALVIICLTQSGLSTDDADLELNFAEREMTRTMQRLDHLVSKQTSLAKTAQLASAEQLSSDTRGFQATGVVAEADAQLQSSIHGLAREYREQDRMKRRQQEERKLREEKAKQKLVSIKTKARYEAKHESQHLSKKIRKLSATLQAVNAEESTQKGKIKMEKAMRDAKKEAEQATVDAKKEARMEIRQAHERLRKRKLWADKAVVRLQAVEEGAADVVEHKLTQVKIDVENAKLNADGATMRAEHALKMVTLKTPEVPEVA